MTAPDRVPLETNTSAIGRVEPPKLTIGRLEARSPAIRPLEARSPSTGGDRA